MLGNPFYTTTTNHGSKKGKQLSCFNGCIRRCRGIELIGIFKLSLLSKHINKNQLDFIGMTALLF